MNNYDLTNVPAVMSNERKMTLSDKYQMFNTGKVIEMMNQEGWYVAKVQQRNARDKSMSHVKPHLVRFRNDDVSLRCCTKTKNSVELLYDKIQSLLIMQSRERKSESEILQEVSRSIYEELEKVASNVSRAKKEGFVQELCRCLLQEREISQEKLREMWQYQLTNAPSRLQQAIGDNMALQNVPRATSQTLQVNDVIPEIVILNSHDGSTPFKMYGGLYRLVCSNGLIVTQNEYMNISARHMGMEQDTLHTMLLEMLSKFLVLNSRIEEMKNRILSPIETKTFAEQAIQIRWKGKMLVSPNEVLVPRRQQDYKDDLWTVFNTIQENCIKGGLYIKTNEKGERIVTRKISNVSEDIRINTELYKLAEEKI